MSYDAHESGHGRPVDLYEFARAHLRWRYTSADRDITIAPHTYTSVTIERGPVEVSQEVERAHLEVYCAPTLEVVDQYRVAPPSDAITLILRQIHYGDDDPVVVWSGRILSVSWQSDRAVMRCEPVYTSVRRMGLRRRYQRTCPHVLYGRGCNLSHTAWMLSSTANNISGVHVQAPGISAMGDGYYAGGWIEWDTPSGVVERRHIMSHVGPTLELVSQPIGLLLGQAIRIYPGCDHTLATCDSKFGNVANYGGMPYIPARNPFAGLDPIY